MKKLSLLIICAFVSVSTIHAQLSFSNSSTNLPSNYVTNGIVNTSTSNVYVCGALYNAGWTPKIYKSTDTGASWTNVAISGISSTQILYNAFCYTGTKFLLATQDNASSNTGIYSSIDATNWTLSNTGIAANFVGHGIAKAANSDILAVGALYNVGWTPIVYKSTDGGLNWTAVSISGINAAHVMFTSICYTGTKFLMSAINNAYNNAGLYSSSDGVNWTLENTSIPLNYGGNGFAVMSSQEIYSVGSLYNAGWTPKIYKTINGGSSWTEVTFSGVPSSQILFNDICNTGSKLLLLTQDNASSATGIYSTASSAVDIKETNADNKFSYYPNPATETVYLQSNEKAQFVNVTDLNAKQLLQSNYQNTIDVSALNKGVYLIQVVGTDFVETKKIMIQ